MPDYPAFQVLPVIVGGITYGMKLLYELSAWLVSLPIAGLVAFIVFLWVANRIMHCSRERRRQRVEREQAEREGLGIMTTTTVVLAPSGGAGGGGGQSRVYTPDSQSGLPRLRSSKNTTLRRCVVQTERSSWSGSSGQSNASRLTLGHGGGAAVPCLLVVAR